MKTNGKIRVLVVIFSVLVMSLSMLVGGIIVENKNFIKPEVEIEGVQVPTGGESGAGSESNSDTVRGEEVVDGIEVNDRVVIDENETLVMDSGTILEKSAEKGGAIYVSSGATFTMAGGLISSCSATGNGGAIYVAAGGRCIINGGVIDDCSAVNGGGIYVEAGGVLQIVVGEIKNCDATGNGGGIYIAETTAAASLSEESFVFESSAIVTLNKARIGAGIYILGGKNSIGGTISYNESTNNGGGLFLGKGTNIVTGTAKIDNNTSKQHGGGVYVNSGWGNNTFEEKAEITNNTAESNGGGLFLNEATNNIRCKIINNTAKGNGGGVYTIAGGNNFYASALIQYNNATNGAGISASLSKGKNQIYGTIELNEATQNGGGIYVEKGNTQIYDLDIINNTATNFGGGVYVLSGTFSINTTGIAAMHEGACSLELKVNKATEGNGGGIYFVGSGSERTLKNVTINQCEAKNGGGIFADEDTILKLENCTISDSKATTGNGGGVYLETGASLDGEGYIYKCKAELGNGGGIYLGKDSTLNIQGSTIESCLAPGGNGGGIYYNGSTSEKIINGVIINLCEAKNGGGIFEAKDTILKLENCTISDCKATTGNGGGVYIAEDSKHDTFTEETYSFKMIGTSVCKNKAENGSGGGIFLANGKNYITSGLIYENKAKNGGGVFVNNAGMNTFGDITDGYALKIYKNEATSAGGGLRLSTGTNTIACDIYENTATGNGGGIHMYDATNNNFTSVASIHDNNSLASGGGIFILKGKNNISSNIYSNTATTNGGGVYISGGTVTVGGAIYFNEATSNGGGIYVNGGTVTIEAVVYSNSTIANGGGIYLAAGTTDINITTETISVEEEGTTTDVSVALSRNNAANGAGLYIVNGLNSISCLISENTATGNGGGIYIDKDYKLSLEGITVDCCEATNGGGIFAASGVNLSISNSVVSNCKAEQGNGGGIYISDSRYTKDFSEGEYSFQMQLTNVYLNQSTNYGGGIYIYTGKNLLQSGSIYSNDANNGAGVYVERNGTNIFGTVDGTGEELKIYNNTASNVGGGLRLSIGINTIACEIYDNTATNNGGGVHIYAGNNTFEVISKVYSNDAQNGGGIFVQDNTELTSFKGAVYSNEAYTYGGGIYINAGINSILETANIYDNIALSGGGIYVNNHKDTLTIHGENFGNEATANGGGLFVRTGKVTVKSLIYLNSALNGGGAYIHSGTVNISITSKVKSMDLGGDQPEDISVAITGNKATGNGGGVYLNGGETQISNSVTYNEAAQNGGGIYIGATCKLNFSYLVSHCTAQNGGGIYSADNARLSLSGGCEISYCTALNGNGGGVYIAEGGSASEFTTMDTLPFFMENTAIHSNTAIRNKESSSGGLGGGVYIAKGKTWLETGSIYSNTAYNGGGVFVENDGHNTFGRLDGVAGEFQVYNNTASNAGGGLRLSTGTNIIACEIYLNTAAGDGGGVHIYGSSSKCTFNSNALIYENQAKNGAGIFITNGNNTINCVLFSNYASGKGGALYIGSGTNTVEVEPTFIEVKPDGPTGSYYQFEDVTIESNQAKRGGAIYINDGTNTINCDFEDNMATGVLTNTSNIVGNYDYVAGGALYINGGTNTVIGNFISNTARFESAVLTNSKDNSIRVYGGGVAIFGGTNIIEGDFSSNVITTYGSDVTNLTETDRILFYGGAVYSVGETTTIIGDMSNNSALEENTSSAQDYSEGGSIYCWGIDYSGTISGSYACNGGGIYTCDDITGDITVQNCEATNGGGIYLYNVGSEITNLTVIGNKATNGGGIYIMDSSYDEDTYLPSSNNFSNIYVHGNTADIGGGVYISEGFHNFVGGSISENTANKSGGIRLTGDCEVLIDGVNISKNKAYVEGGGISVMWGSVLTMKSGEITENYIEAKSVVDVLKGGGIFVGDGQSWNRPTFVMNGGKVSSNYIKGTTAIIVSSNCAGGGIYVCAQGECRLNGGTVVDNYITGSYSNAAGGQIMVTDTALLSINDGAKITSTLNKSLADFGGAIAVAGGEVPGKLNMTGGIIEDCIGKFGGAIAAYGTINLSGGIIRNCTATGNVGHAITTIGTISFAGDAVVEGQISVGASYKKGGFLSSDSIADYYAEIHFKSLPKNIFDISLCQFSLTETDGQISGVTPEANTTWALKRYDINASEGLNSSLVTVYYNGNEGDAIEKLRLNGFGFVENSSKSFQIRSGVTSGQTLTLNILDKDSNLIDTNYYNIHSNGAETLHIKNYGVSATINNFNKIVQNADGIGNSNTKIINYDRGLIVEYISGSETHILKYGQEIELGTLEDMTINVYYTDEDYNTLTINVYNPWNKTEFKKLLQSLVIPIDSRLYFETSSDGLTFNLKLTYDDIWTVDNKYNLYTFELDASKFEYIEAINYIYQETFLYNSYMLDEILNPGKNVDILVEANVEVTVWIEKQEQKRQMISVDTGTRDGGADNMKEFIVSYGEIELTLNYIDSLYVEIIINYFNENNEAESFVVVRKIIETGNYITISIDETSTGGTQNNYAFNLEADASETYVIPDGADLLLLF